jgi:hypothetical protein
MSTLCIGLFSDRGQADAAVEELRQFGVTGDDISAIFSGRHANEPLRSWEAQHHLGTTDQDVRDGEAGGLKSLGSTWLILEAGSLTLPIAGYALALGGLVIGAVGVAANSVLSQDRPSLGLILRELGLAEAEARYHEKQVAKGAHLVVVDGTRWTATEIREIMLRHGAEDRLAAPEPAPAGKGLAGRLSLLFPKRAKKE